MLITTSWDFSTTTNTRRGNRKPKSFLSFFVKKRSIITTLKLQKLGSKPSKNDKDLQLIFFSEKACKACKFSSKKIKITSSSSRKKEIKKPPKVSRHRWVNCIMIFLLCSSLRSSSIEKSKKLFM